jgi:hypothetical protein
MTPYSNYFRQRLNAQDIRVKNIISSYKIHTNNINNKDVIIIGKKRKYEEAMGYPNDYEVVQESN